MTSDKARLCCCDACHSHYSLVRQSDMILKDVLERKEDKPANTETILNSDGQCP